jgi:hypothetical protein
MGKTAVRHGSVSGSPNGVRRSAPFDVHEYTPLEMIRVNPMLVLGVTGRTRPTRLVQRISGQFLNVVQSTRVLTLNPELVIGK